MADLLYPLKFRPIYKHYLWGGRNLAKLGKPIPENTIVAESWEVADHGSDVSVVANGPLAGWSMHDLIDRFGAELCPPTQYGRFPLLVKYIDAANKLSVQVHPDDRYAATHESPDEMGKNECWYVMDAQPGAELILGLREKVNRQELAEMIEQGRIEEGLARQKVGSGDFIFIRTGTVHALLEGIMVCEIQQNSDTTYRLYDWDRVDAQGNGRPLHVDKALDVIENPPETGYEEYLRKLIIPYDQTAGDQAQPMIRSRFFNIDILSCTGELATNFQDEHFHILNIVEGSGELGWSGGRETLTTGDSVLIPRSVGAYSVTAGPDEGRTLKAVKSFL
jgi:mannose-6-phosphate isomerase